MQKKLCNTRNKIVRTTNKIEKKNVIIPFNFFILVYIKIYRYKLQQKFFCIRYLTMMITRYLYRFSFFLSVFFLLVEGPFRNETLLFEKKKKKKNVQVYLNVRNTCGRSVADILITFISSLYKDNI